MSKLDRRQAIALGASSIASLMLSRLPALASVSAADAAQLKTTLTPLGAERAGNKDGSIPAWSGATPQVNFRANPFIAEKPILVISAKNAQQYADALNDGTKAMFARYPDFQVNVYPSHRTASAPQWMYDATYQNALHGTMKDYIPQNIYGGVPFPIPKTGLEVIWNSLLRWQPPSFQFRVLGVETGSDGRHDPVVEVVGKQQAPYYFEGGQKAFKGDYYELLLTDVGPPLRIGEALLDIYNLDAARDRSWTYVPGQRRVRMLPNSSYDTPTPASAGLMSFDETHVFAGQPDRYDWKIEGKREMYVPYNNNGYATAIADDLLSPHFVNPARARWELHRVWVISATLRAGQRHQSPTAKFYVDEDSWIAILGDRWDARKQFWKAGFTLPFMLGGKNGGVFEFTYGQYDLESGSWFLGGCLNRSDYYYTEVARYPEDSFSPDVMLRNAR
jgi:hypothetical protein